MQTALSTVSQAIATLKPRLSVTWLLDSGFDDVAVWRTIWEQHEHLVCRIAHPERLVEREDGQGRWQAATLAEARKQSALVARAQTLLEVQKRGQPRAKRRRVTAEIRACPLQLTYAGNVRRTGEGEQIRRVVWLVEISLQDTALDPWLLLTDLEVVTQTQALQVFQMYRRR